MLFLITKKQINVIYGAWKRGDIKADQSVLGTMYRMVEHQGRDGSGSLLSRMDDAIRGAIDAIFSRDFAKAQECIDAFVQADEESKREWEEIEAMKAFLAAQRAQAAASA